MKKKDKRTFYFNAKIRYIKEYCAGENEEKSYVDSVLAIYRPNTKINHLHAVGIHFNKVMKRQAKEKVHMLTY